ncbi:hypothetical protein PHMEG_00018911 [Phytophthora megakarya]|uniref:CCHC-type domain-containing protein n=1 Tax=Phytophthora megakarya TaxID=4795 RepID=A0A225VSL7_9STRA|nr:hypothetical protein PHMEG_00018911 [Phytophthora megakarya]
MLSLGTLVTAQEATDGSDVNMESARGLVPAGTGSRLKRQHWKDLEQELQQTTAVISFSMTGSSTVVDECTITLQHFRRDILEVCRTKGVLFEDNQLADGLTTKRPMFTGSNNTNLTLNELEYINCNRVSFAQLREIFRRWAGKTSSWSLMPRILTCTTSDKTTNVVLPTVFKLLRTQRQTQCTPSVYISQVSAERIRYRLHRQDEFKVGIFGVRIEMRPKNIEHIFLDNELGNIRGSRALFAIGYCSSKDQMENILQKFGPDAANPFKHKNISMSIKQWDANPPQRKCYECNEPGHFRFNCPRRNRVNSALPLPGASTAVTTVGSQACVVPMGGSGIDFTEEYIEKKLDQLT